MTWEIRDGDCIERMRELDDDSIDAVVCDPPYGIGFMGHDWDQPGEYGALRGAGRPAPFASGKKYPGKHVVGGREGVRGREGGVQGSGGSMEAGRYDLSLTANRRYQAWCEAWAREAFRVLKPGGHLLASCGTRTYHRLAAGVEDAGFEIRDSLLWLYGSGFPKSLDVSKAIDKAQGVEGEWRQEDHPGRAGVRKRADSASNFGQTDYGEEGNERHVYEPGSEEARQWQGWGTALKPSHEPIVMARKPLAGTVAANVLEHGTGALNIDRCRIGTDDDTRRPPSDTTLGLMNDDGWEPKAVETGGHDGGRWPSNVVLSEEAAEELDEQSGNRKAGGSVSGSEPSRTGVNAYGEYDRVSFDSHGDTGGASRFFYCAKTSRAERNAGLTASSTPLLAAGATPQDAEEADWSERNGNHHPTVKPINLMRWLVRLVTPPGGLVLDPFTGSGSTGCAAVLEGFDFIGIEREPDYVAIGEARVTFWAQHVGREVEEVLGLYAESQRQAKQHADVGQLELG